MTRRWPAEDGGHRASPRSLPSSPCLRQAGLSFFFAGGSSKARAGRREVAVHCVAANGSRLFVIGSYSGYMSRLAPGVQNSPGIRLWEVQRPKRQGHPRHPPRAFSLGLLAPSMVCAALFLALPRLRARCSGAAPFGGRKDSFPQRQPRLVRPLPACRHAGAAHVA